MIDKKEVAKRLNISLRTVSRYMSKGLPYYKSPINSKVWFKEEEVEEWRKKLIPSEED